MSKFEDFLMDSFEESEVVEKAVTMGGKERKMQFKAIGANLGDELRKKCKKVTVVKGQKITESNQDKFMSNLIIESTVYPDLKNAELQESWGVKGAEELLYAMKSRMSDGEYSEWGAVVSSVNGYDKGMSELIEEAKN